jgi:hypothetical protein
MYKPGKLENLLDHPKETTSVAKHDSASILQIIKQKLDEIQRAAIEDSK